MDEQSRRRQQVREASRRLRKRRKDEQDALRAEVENLRSLVDRLRSESDGHTRPEAGDTGPSTGDAPRADPGGARPSQREAALEKEVQALQARLEEASAAQRVLSELHSTLRSSPPARRVVRLLASITESDSVQTALCAVAGEGDPPAEPQPGRAGAADLGTALSRLHAADAAVAGITAHRLQPPAAADPQARSRQDGARAAAAGPRPPTCVVVVREPRADGSERERRVHVSAGNPEEEDLDAAALQAMARLLPVRRCQFFTPAAVTRSDALECTAIETLHGIPSVLSTGWSPAAEVLPGVFLRSRNVFHPYPARLAETFISNSYEDTTAFIVGVLNGSSANLILGHGSDAMILGNSQVRRRYASPPLPAA